MNFCISRPIAPLLAAAVALSACGTTHNPVGSSLAMLKPGKPTSTPYITGLQGGIIGPLHARPGVRVANHVPGGNLVVNREAVDLGRRKHQRRQR